MIRPRRLACDGCGESGPETDHPRPDREYLEHDAGERGWLVRERRHYCRTCRLAIERNSLVPAAAEGGGS